MELNPPTVDAELDEFLTGELGDDWKEMYLEWKLFWEENTKYKNKRNGVTNESSTRA